jgi:hypothetical protein
MHKKIYEKMGIPESPIGRRKITRKFVKENLDINQKVVCVDDKFPVGIEKLYDQLPVKDMTYVIRDLQMGICLDCKTGTVSVLLVGVVNPKADSKANLERGFHPDRFRPLDEMKETSKQTKPEQKPQTVTA